MAVLLGVCLFAGQGYCAGASNAELEGRIQGAKRVMDDIMQTPDRSIPEELLAKCEAIAIYPNTVNGAFIFGVRYGRGVVLAKDAQTGHWGPVAFSTIGGGSFGLQIGGQAADLVLVIMNKKGLNGLLADQMKLGASASVAAGPMGRHSEAGTDLFLQSEIISYSRTKGIFAGVSLDGAIVTSDNRSNSIYYGKNVTSKEILMGNAVSVTPSALELVNALNDFSGRWQKRVGLKA